MENKTVINEKYYYTILIWGHLMKLLMATKKEKKRYPFLKEAFEERGFTVKSADLKDLSLYSERKKSRIEGPRLGIKNTSAAYLEAGLQLTQFVEPLLDELERRAIYCQVKAGSHFILSNELLQITALNNYSIRIPRTFIFKDRGKLKQLSERLSFPVLFKTFSKGAKSQSFIVESAKSLLSVSEGIKYNIDGLLLREFIEGDIDQCAVVGKDVFSIQRKFEKGDLQPVKKAVMAKVSAQDKEAAIQAANVCGCDIATVKMCRGFVLKVKPLVDLLTYNKKTGDNLFENVAALFAEKTGLGAAAEKPVEEEPEEADESA